MTDRVSREGVAPEAAQTSHDATPGPQASDAQRTRVSGPIIQTKLSVGAAGDSYEREADAVAAKIVRALQSAGPVGAAGGAEESGRVQRAAGTQSAAGQPVESVTPVQRVQRIQRAAHIGAAGGDVDSDTERMIQSAGSGSPMPDTARSSMETAFGADFGAVRVHSGPRASELNERIQAKAFTTGNNIFFRDGLPDASSSSGQELLAHELTHTIQQGGGKIQRSPQLIQRNGVLHMDENGVGHEAPGDGVIHMDGSGVGHDQPGDGVNHMASGDGVFHMDERGVGHDAPGSGVLHMDSVGVGHNSPFLDGQTGVGEYIASPASLSELATSAEVSHGFWAKDNDVLLEILLGPFEANWFKAKECLTMEKWPFANDHPRPSHDVGIQLMQAMVVMRKAKWTHFIETIVKPQFKDRMQMFGAVNEQGDAALQTSPDGVDLQSDIDKSMKSKEEGGQELQEIFDSVGAEAVTSDVDLASGGSNSELGIQFVNERFRSQFADRKLPYDPGTVFDINVYASDWLHGDLGSADTLARDSAGASTRVRTITPATEVRTTTAPDELIRVRKMEVWSLVKVRRNLSDAEWATYQETTLAHLTDEEASAEMASKLSEADMEHSIFKTKVEDRQREMKAKLDAQVEEFRGGQSAFGDAHFAEDASVTRASNEIYEETLQTVKERRLWIERLRADDAVGNADEISRVGVLLSDKIAEALTYANEVYATEGAVKHTVLKQGAGKKLAKLKKKGEGDGDADLTGLEYDLAPELYLQAVNENVGDSLHSIKHFHAMPKYAVYRAGKYLARMIDATNMLLDDAPSAGLPSYANLLKIGTESVRVKALGGDKGDPAGAEGDPKFVDDDPFFQGYREDQLQGIRDEIIQFGAMIPKLFTDKQKADKQKADEARALAAAPSK
jgi:hypothetical protein